MIYHEPDRRRWRIGTHYGIHIYAVNPGQPEHDVPIASAFTTAAAAQIVREHNAAIEPDTEESRLARALDPTIRLGNDGPGWMGDSS